MPLYQPYFNLPNDLDASVDNNITLTINGTICNGFRIYIYKNSDNSLIYNPASVNLTSNPLYNGDQLTITIPSTSGILNGTDYKIKIRLFEVFETTYVDSLEYYFKCTKTPTVSIANIPIDNIITSKQFEFVGNYTSEQNVAIKFHQWDIYDGNNQLIKSSGKVFSSRLKFEMDGFISNQNYKVSLLVENQNNKQIKTETNIQVQYDEPQLSIKPTTIINHSSDSVTVSWSQAYSIPASYSVGTPIYPSSTRYPGASLFPNSGGTIYDFIETGFYEGDKALHINPYKVIYYDEINSQPMNIPEDSTIFMYINIPLNFNGKIIELESEVKNTETVNIPPSANINVTNPSTSEITVQGNITGLENTTVEERDYYTVLFDGTKFTYSIGTTITGEYTDVNITGDDNWWKITLLPDKVLFHRTSYGVLLPSDDLYPSDNLVPTFSPI